MRIKEREQGDKYNREKTETYRERKLKQKHIEEIMHL